MSNEEQKTALPKLRFPEFAESKEWKKTKLGDTSDIITGNTPSTSEPDNYGGDIMFISPADISEKRYVTNSKSYLSKKGFAKTRPIQANSVMFVCIGSTIGKVAQNKFECATNQQINSILPKGEYSSDFVYSILEYNANEIAAAAGRQAVPIINKSTFSAFEVYFPTYNEQAKIAECLLSLDDLINGVSDKIEALKEYKKGLMQQLFPAEGKTTPAYRFLKSEDWEVKALAVICDNLDNKRVPITSGQRKAGSTPYYGASGIIDYVEGYIYNEGLLCISEDGANLVDRNYPIAFAISGKAWVNNHAHVLRFDNKVIQILVENYINSISVKDFLTGMAQPKLNRKKLDSIPIPLPKDPKEQEQIAKCLASIENLITSETQRFKQLEDHKKGLMQQLFPNLNE